MKKSIRLFLSRIALLSSLGFIACSSSSSPSTGPGGSSSSPSAITVGGGTLCIDIPRFALCTSAPCQIDTSDPNYLICECVVETGANWGKKTTCEDRIPHGNELRSNFSPIQAGPPLNLKALTCDNQQNWASCLDAPCKSDPSDPKKAKCKCPVATTTPWLTFGGKCDPRCV